MLTLFQKLVNSFGISYRNELEEYIAIRNPQTAEDLERLQREFTYKKIGGWI